jgi:hypothetical protein
LTPASADAKLGPARPSLRLGVEVEGMHAGAPTLVVLGRVPWRLVQRHAPRARHVFWELASGQQPWRAVRALLSSGFSVTLDTPGDPGRVPSDVAELVELMVRAPASWAMVDAVKICDGGFNVWWATTRWRVNTTRDYEGDEELWRGDK